MKNLTTLFILAILLFSACTKNRNIAEFKTSDFLIGISDKGSISDFKDLKSGTEYLATDTLAPLLSCRVDSVMFYPVSAAFENGTITIQFPENMAARIKVEEKSGYITFELTEFSPNEKVELVVWGPFPTKIRQIIGETVGVVRDSAFAIGLQALNPKTLGGYPWTDNDCTPQFDIFEQEDYSDLSEANKRETLYRIEAAKPEKFGSTLQAYCRNRNKERIIENLSHKKYVSPVFEDGGIIGSKIALFGCQAGNALKTIGNIETGEGLPHPTIDGEWGKTAKSASAAYLIFDFSEANIDKAIEYTKKAGLRYLYHSGPFKNWGHFELNPAAFPHGWDGLKMCVEKAEKEGIHVGVHTLSNFITTNDPYVTPVPDPRLAKVGSSVISKNIDANQTEIEVESPDFFRQYDNNNLHTVMVDSELIRYETVSETAPWILKNCERGAWGTQKSSHEKGASISLLADHGYKVFLSNPELSIEIAGKLAELYNYCGLRQISFDGLEGNRSTGMGNYGEILFTTSWWNHLSEEVKKHTIIDASRTTHYFWHVYSRMNWGEPWYAGFRESQTEYRLKNQAYFQRNLMPGMLGWFSMRENTPVEDIEWMLARSAAFDAGYAFVTGDRQLENNGLSEEILKLISEWEKARMSGAFSQAQKEKMKNINNEFHLETLGGNRWNLCQLHIFRFKYDDRERQPGEPAFSSFQFENPENDAELHFILTVQDASITKIRIEIDNSRKINLPVILKTGESAKYSGTNSVHIFDATNHKTGEIKIGEALQKLSPGKHAVSFECEFLEKEKEPAAGLEIRLKGKAEELSSR